MMQVSKMVHHLYSFSKNTDKAAHLKELFSYQKKAISFLIKENRHAHKQHVPDS